MPAEIKMAAMTGFYACLTNGHGIRRCSASREMVALQQTDEAWN